MAPTELKAKPDWLRVKFPTGANYRWLLDKSHSLKLATVCEEALCPNIGECWSSGTATFMVMGDCCTRSCRFCAVKTSKKPDPLDSMEPIKLANTLRKLNLTYVVLTSVDRDDLPDQGAAHIASCITRSKMLNPELLIEMLMPDFRGQADLIAKLCQSGVDVLSHNIETVARLSPKVRDRRASYKQSLNVLAYIKENYPKIYTKSSIMVGLGEQKAEVLAAMDDLRTIGVDFLTIGQYLQPRRSLLKVADYVTPADFKFYEEHALKKGFLYAACGPLVRSSYKAGEFFIQRLLKDKN